MLVYSIEVFLKVSLPRFFPFELRLAYCIREGCYSEKADVVRRVSKGLRPIVLLVFRSRIGLGELVIALIRGEFIRHCFVSERLTACVLLCVLMSQIRILLIFDRFVLWRVPSERLRRLRIGVDESLLLSLLIFSRLRFRSLWLQASRWTVDFVDEARASFRRDRHAAVLIAHELCLNRAYFHHEVSRDFFETALNLR